MGRASGIGTIIGGALGAVGGPVGIAIGAGLGRALGGAMDAQYDMERMQENLGEIKSEATALERRIIPGYEKLAKLGEDRRTLLQSRAQLLQQQPFVSDMVTQQGAEMAMRSAIASAQAQGLGAGMAGALAARGAAQSQVDVFAKGAASRVIEQLERERMVTDLLQAGEEARQQALLQSLEGQRAIAAMRRGVQTQMMQTQAHMHAANQQREGALFGAIGQGIGAYLMAANKGGLVTGRAKKEGDSPENDVVPALLSPGELVVPRTVVKKGPDAVKKFAEKILKKQSKENGY